MKHNMIQTKSCYNIIISALSSKNQDQVEYLSGEDLALKPNTIEQARFEYCVRFLIKG